MASDNGKRALRVELLGPLRLLVDGVAVDVAGTKRRAVLALLAFAEGRAVASHHLVEALWPADAAESGRTALHNQVSRVRRHLGPTADRLQTAPAGYRLELGAEGLDVTEARALLTAATAIATHDPSQSYDLLRKAYGLWRGPVLADLIEITAIAVAVESCERLRRDVTDALIAAGVTVGKATSVVDIAEVSFQEDGLREPATLLFMRALASVGRAPEAIRVGTDYRRRLADETGLDPSPALDDLIRDIARGSAGPAPSSESTAHQPGNTVAKPTAIGALARGSTSDRLIGREAVVAALHRILANERLVSLVGPGGVGKTRVALEVGRRSTAVTVLLLAPIADPAAIPHALAAALDLTVVQGDPLSVCVGVLNESPGLLLIDNCEHVLDGVRDLVETVLAACPQLSVLTTSREPLGISAEYVSRLAPLPLPGGTHQLAHVPSVALFLDRAARVRPDSALTSDQLPAVADVVRRLDGMPLAIELAAGRLSTFSIEDLRDRLDRALDLLGHGGGHGRTGATTGRTGAREGRAVDSIPGGDRRHATLRATIEWSYALLTDDQQRLFRNLSVFVDGADIDTVERIGTDLHLDTDPGSVLARLVDASMIVADLTTRPRYRMLHLLRAFGMDRLAAAGEADAAVERLTRWAVDLTASIEDDLLTDREPAADAVLRRELPNLRYAWQQMRARAALDAAAAMVSALHDAVTYRDLVEIREWAEELADDPGTLNDPRAAAVLGTAAEAAYHRGDYGRADALARRGLELAVDGAGRWRCLLTLCVVDLAREEHNACVAHALAAVDVGRKLREEFGIAALAHAYRGHLDEARLLNERGIAAARSPTMRSWGAYVAGEIDNFAGLPKQAEQHYIQSIDLARLSGATFLVGVASLGLLTVRAAVGQPLEALTGFREVIEYFARNGDWTHQWVVLRNLATLLRRIGDPAASEILGAAANRAGASDRPAALDIARQAIARHQLGRS
jgi:predicted ATPase/DNA-binding SARP family transcriptional activator